MWTLDIFCTYIFYISVYMHSVHSWVLHIVILSCFCFYWSSETRDKPESSSLFGMHKLSQKSWMGLGLWSSPLARAGWRDSTTVRRSAEAGTVVPPEETPHVAVQSLPLPLATLQRVVNSSSGGSRRTRARSLASWTQEMRGTRMHTEIISMFVWDTDE